MGESLVISRDFGAMKASELLAFPGSVSKKASKLISGSADELIRNISVLLEEMVISVIEKRTSSEFSLARESVFPNYFVAVLGMSSLIQIIVSRQAMERLNREFFCELEADLRESGVRFFGASVSEQAMFTVWTLRKISDYMTQIAHASPEKFAENLEPASKLVSQCIYHAVRTRFHVHCLTVSMAQNRPIYGEVIGDVIDGLRSVVNAYALTRRLLDLAVPQQEPQVSITEWDDEDEALLQESSLDSVGDID